MYELKWFDVPPALSTLDNLNGMQMKLTIHQVKKDSVENSQRLRVSATLDLIALCDLQTIWSRPRTQDNSVRAFPIGSEFSCV